VPWRPPLYPTTTERLRHGAWRKAHLDIHRALWALIEDVCAACTVVLQSEAGIRINEVCGLRAGINADTGMPAPVRAVHVLQELYAPVRSVSTDGKPCKDLIVPMTQSGGLPKSGPMIGKILGRHLLAYQRRFIGTYVDLSGLPDRNRQRRKIARARYRDRERT
jgi:hypothetical protein